MTPAVRSLRRGDEAAVEAFLQARLDSSLFLLSNLRAAALEDDGEVYSGAWAAAFEQAAIVGVAAHFWNGVLVVQAPRELDAVVRAALRASGRPLAGISGPYPQVRAARASLAPAAAVAMHHEAELFSLVLSDLRVPEALARGALRSASPAPPLIPRLADWRVSYAVETLRATRSDALRAACEKEVRQLVEEGNAFVLLEGEAPVAFSAFNARLPEVVQVGGVYTPPELRGRGYARAVVAGSLLAARRARVARAVLFTERENEPARRAYLALGFRPTGDYGLVLFASPAPPGPPPGLRSRQLR